MKNKHSDSFTSRVGSALPMCPRAVTLFFPAFALALAVLVAAPTRAAAGEPPEIVSYQGYVVDSNGKPLGTSESGDALPSNYDVIFRIYNAASGGTLLWAEQQTITVDSGYFSVLLGEGAQVGSDPNPNLSSVFTGVSASERFIGIAVQFQAGGSFDEILPRLRLLSAPYAFLSSQTRSLVTPDGMPLITAEADTVTIDGNLNVTSGTLHVDRIPELPASKITSGVFADARLPLVVGGNRRFTGNVGIGSAAPAARLHVSDGGIRLDGANTLEFGGGLSKQADAGKIGYGTWTSGALDIVGGGTTAGNRRIKLWNEGGASTSGHVGIRTDSPDRPLTIQGTDANSEWVSFKNTAGVTRWHINHINDGLNFAQSGAADGRLFLAAGGNVGIGTTSPGSRLQVNGTVRITGDARIDGWIRQPFGGTVYRLNRDIFGDARWVSESDERLKSNIETIPSAVDTIKKLRGVTWNWNDDAVQHFTRNIELDYGSLSGTPEDDRKVWEEKRREAVERHSKLQIGFVAQEVEKVFPDWVSTGEGGYRQIHMERLNAVLVNAINEQQEQIDALKQDFTGRLASLEAENKELKRQLEEMVTAQALHPSESERDSELASLRQAVGELRTAVHAFLEAQPGGQ